MFNTVVALLEAKGIITEKEAEKLAKELGTALLPSDYRETKRLIKKILIKL